MPVAHARIATDDASRLIKRLCTHWRHKFPVEFDSERGRVPFDDATVATLHAGPDHLAARIEAADGARLAQMQDVVAEHLQRMARGDRPLRIEWSAEDADVA